MVAAVVVVGEPALGVDGAAEFAAPDDQRVVEHAALFEVLHQAIQAWSTSLHWGEPAADVRVGVPIIVIDLHEAHAALDQPAGEQGGGGEGAGLAGFFPVKFERRFRLTLDADQFGHTRLHAEGQFVLLDAGVCFGIADELVVQFVELVRPSSCRGEHRWRRPADC